LTSGGGVKCATVALNLGDGRYPFTDYDTNSGYYYFLRVAWIGSFYDKILSIITLTDPTTNFIGVDTAGDIRKFAIGYNLMFPDLMHRFFSSIASDRIDDYAPYGQNGVMLDRPAFHGVGQAATDLSVPLAPCSGAGCVPFDVSNNFTIRLYTMLYGMAYFSSTFNPEFLDSSQICVRGNGECSIPEAQSCDPADNPTGGAPCVEFISPTNNKTYRALKKGPIGETGLGTSMLARAASYSAAYQAALAPTGPSGPVNPSQKAVDYTKSRLTNAVEDMEIVRGFYSVFGYLR
jgi:hypothetical protein